MPNFTVTPDLFRGPPVRTLIRGLEFDNFSLIHPVIASEREAIQGFCATPWIAAEPAAPRNNESNSRHSALVGGPVDAGTSPA